MEAANQIVLLPPLLGGFLLTLVMSFLLGLGLREYYWVEKKIYYFGSTRTCSLVGLLGFVLYQLQPEGRFFLAGLLVLSAFFGIYYAAKLREKQPGLIGILIALMCYTIGPVAMLLPHWFLVLFTISALFVLHAKEKINHLTASLGNEELMSLGKFLILSGVILPLTPSTPIADFIPVSFHQTWLAVVVISGISYLGYLVQTYWMQGHGIVLTGAIGGIYSSTATTVVLARQSHAYPEASCSPSAAIILSTAVMYLRLLVVIGIFKLSLALALMPIFLGLAALSGALAWWIRHRNGSLGNGDSGFAHRPENPLELTSAILFAVMFVIITAGTKFALSYYADEGLLWMAFFTGFADIDPFILSLVQGKLIAQNAVLMKAIIIATASNNVLKGVYALAWANRHTGRLAGSVLAGLGLMTLLYGFFG